MKEFFRKKLVYIKRHSQIIPFLFIIFSCIVFTFNLSSIGTTIATIGSDSAKLALQFFIITFSSFMSVILFLGALKVMNKKTLGVIGIVTALMIIQLVLSLILFLDIQKYFFGAEKIISMIPEAETARLVLIFNIIFIGLYFLTLAMYPIYSKKLLKIDTQTEEERALIKASMEESTENMDLSEDV